MMRVGELWRRALFFCRRRRMGEELEEEIRLHIALRAAKLTDLGVSSIEAAHAAHRQFGNETAVKEVSRDMWGWISMERFLRDMGLAARSLRKNPLFSAMAIATFALGIGANTAIFSVVNGVLLRPLPYPQPDAIVHLSLVWKGGDLNDTLTVPDFEFYRDHSSALQAVAGFRGAGTLGLRRDHETQWITSMKVTDGFFAVLGLHPAIGRDIQRSDTRPGSAPVAVLSDSLWRNSFGADPRVIGRQIVLDDTPYTVIGVTDHRFTFAQQPSDIFVPLQLGQTIADTGMNTRVIARLRPRTTLAQAQANTNVVFEAFQRTGLVQSGQSGVRLESYQRWLAGDFRTSILMLFGAVAFLLLVACANVASLFMARASSRQREIAIRLAIGSGRSRLLQQFLAESLMIALTGGAAGILAANWILRVLVSSIPWDMPLTGEIQIDARVLAFTSLGILAISLIFAFTSYWQAVRMDVNASLKGGSAASSQQLMPNRARSFLVIGELAVSLVLLTGAGLLMESIYRLQQQNLGFNPRNVYTMTTPFESSAKLSPYQIQSFEQAVVARVQAEPGVGSVAVTTDLPLTGPDNLPTQQEGHPEHSIGGMEHRAISPQYFRTMQIPIVQGRAFLESDTASTAAVAIVSESVARAWWPGKSPIGDRVVIGEYRGHQYAEILDQPREVVGVVADVKNLAIDEAAPTTLYIPASQLPRAPGSLAWVVRGTGHGSSSDALRRAITALRPDQRILHAEPMPDVVARSIARPNFDASLMSAFAAIALALTSVGIYGLLSFQVTRRTQEIGLRMALGASRASVLVMVLKEAVWLALTGIAVGGVGAFLVVRVLASLLAGVRSTGFLVYGLVPALLLFVALLASYIPARRASKVDPLVALRYE